MFEREHSLYPKPPHEFVVNTGEGYFQASDLVDKFFSSVLETIGFGEKETEIFAKIETRLLAPDRLQHANNIEDLRGIQLIDFVKILSARQFMLASAIFRRNDFNNWQVATTHYLNPEMVSTIKSEMELGRNTL